MQESIKVVLLIIIASVNSRPIMWLDSFEEDYLQDFENYVLSPSELKTYQYITTSETSTESLYASDPTPIILTDKTLKDLSVTKLDNETLKTIGKLMRKGLSLRNALQEVAKVAVTTTTSTPETSTSIYIEEIFPSSTPEKTTTALPNIKKDNILKSSNYSLTAIDDDKDNLTENERPLRQQKENDDESEEVENMKDQEDNNSEVSEDERDPRQQSSEEDSDEDDGGGGGGTGIGGIISAFLSSLSRNYSQKVENEFAVSKYSLLLLTDKINAIQARVQMLRKDRP